MPIAAQARQYFQSFAQDPSADPMYDTGWLLCRDLKVGTVIVQGGWLGAHGLSPGTRVHWLAEMVTTGADPLTPVSAIENSSMMIPKVYLDWVSSGWARCGRGSARLRLPRPERRHAWHQPKAPAAVAQPVIPRVLEGPLRGDSDRR
jgi:hypothetical protein